MARHPSSAKSAACCARIPPVYSACLGHDLSSSSRASALPLCTLCSCACTISPPSCTSGYYGAMNGMFLSVDYALAIDIYPAERTPRAGSLFGASPVSSVHPSVPLCSPHPPLRPATRRRSRHGSSQAGYDAMPRRRRVDGAVRRLLHLVRRTRPREVPSTHSL